MARDRVDSRDMGRRENLFRDIGARDPLSRVIFSRGKMDNRDILSKAMVDRIIDIMLNNYIMCYL